jgi:hypothetical protein
MILTWFKAASVSPNCTVGLRYLALHVRPNQANPPIFGIKWDSILCCLAAALRQAGKINGIDLKER